MSVAGGRTNGSPPGQEASAPARSYHGQPVIKQPTWTWEIPVYFFSGGLAGASAILAALADARGQRVLGRRAWAVSMAGIAASPPLLISDLGRPERFLNMLRMFKLTSPMSVGSWILSGSGATTSLAAVSAWTPLFPRLGVAGRAGAALFGMPLSTYTAALIVDTAVPAWHEAHREMPFLFAAGAALSAGGAAVAATPVEHAGPARHLALAGALVELAAEEVMEKRIGEHARVYEHGAPHLAKRISQACLAGGAALLAARGSQSRALAAVSGGLLLAGAMATRWSVYKAGFASAADPQAVVGPQRGRIERGERPGAARREALSSAAGTSDASPATAAPAHPGDPEQSPVEP